MESRYELISGSLASMYHDIQKIERMEMAKYGLKGPHAQCLLAMKKHPLWSNSRGGVYQYSNPTLAVTSGGCTSLEVAASTGSYADSVSSWVGISATGACAGRFLASAFF
mgnify:CR=1 FL=1